MSTRPDITNIIDSQLAIIASEKRIGLMTHAVAGYPNKEYTVELLKTLADAGSDFIELQIPFSDPIADGSTIVNACDIALQNGTTTTDALEMMQKASQSIKIPLLFMCYYNTIFAYGTQTFCKDASKAGASGLIVPDMPPDEEEYEHFFEACDEYNLYPIRVLSPASTPERIKLNAKRAKGFTYCVSRYGVTGNTQSINSHLKEYIGNIRSYINTPIAVGFGITNRDQVQSLNGIADIAVVGSAIIEKIRSPKTTMKDIKEYVEGLVRQ